jgi:hypothetical protein
MGPRYVLKLLFIEKSQSNNNATAEAREKINVDFESLEF